MKVRNIDSILAAYNIIITINVIFVSLKNCMCLNPGFQISIYDDVSCWTYSFYNNHDNLRIRNLEARSDYTHDLKRTMYLISLLRI